MALLIVTRVLDYVLSYFPLDAKLEFVRFNTINVQVCVLDCVISYLPSQSYKQTKQYRSIPIERAARGPQNACA